MSNGESVSTIRQKGGLLKNIPPTLSKLLVCYPPLCLKNPPNCLTKNRGKIKSKLYKLNYKSGKPFLIKAFLLWAILEITQRATRGGKQLLHRGQTPKAYKLLARANGGVYGGSIER